MKVSEEQMCITPLPGWRVDCEQGGVGGRISFSLSDRNYYITFVFLFN